MEDSSMNSLKELHWLPVEYHVKYKILTITHNCIYGNVPAYLKKKVMLVDCNNIYPLRSNDDIHNLVVPKTKYLTRVIGHLVSMPLSTGICCPMNFENNLV